MKIKILISIILFCLSFYLLSININKPFFGEHDWNGVRYGNIARNYYKYGIFKTNLGQIENSGVIENGNYEFFTHYPPLLPLLIAGSYTFFGVSEWSTRLIPIVASSGIIVLIFLIGGLIKNIRVGIIASLLSLSTPLFLYFGKNPVHEPLVVFLSLLAFLGHIKKSKKLFLLGFILALFTTWAGYFLVPALTIIYLLKKDFKEVKLLLPFWGLSILIFLIHIGHVYFLTGSISGGDLFESFFQRTSITASIQPENLNLLNYLVRLKSWFFILLTFTLTMLTSTWLISKKFTGLRKGDWYILTIGIFGGAYLICFPNAAFIHNYLIFYCLPFFALSSASFLEDLQKMKFFKSFSLIFFATIILLVAVERKDFLFALNKSDGDKLAVQIGKAINQQTDSSDIVLIHPYKFSFSADKFLRFYSDRKLIYSDNVKIKSDAQVLVDMVNHKFQITKTND